MKTAKLILAVATLAAFPYVAAESELSTVDPDIRAEMTALVEAWIEAEVQSDGKANVAPKRNRPSNRGKSIQIMRNR